jgi:hypothetical protein
MRRYRARYIGSRLTALLALVTIVAVACSADPTTEGESASATGSASFLYELPDHPEAAVAFIGNTTIVLARSTHVAEPRIVTLTPGADAPTVTEVWTPVTVTVTDVLAGAVRPGEQLVLRHLGGTIGEVTSIVHGVPPLDAYRPGTDLVLFLGDQPVDVGDGVSAWTPNFVYTVESGEVASARAHDRWRPVPYAELARLVAASHR